MNQAVGSAAKGRNVVPSLVSAGVKVMAPTVALIFVLLGQPEARSAVAIQSGLIKTIKVAGAPGGIVVNEESATVYVVSRLPGSVTIIDGVTDTIVGEVTVGREPSYQIAIDTALDRVYVASSPEGSLSVVDGRLRRLRDTITDVGSHPEGVAYSSKQRRVYVSHSGDRVTIVNTLNNSIDKTIVSTAYNHDIVVDDSQNYAFVSLTKPSGIQGLDLRTADFKRVWRPGGTFALDSATGRYFFVDYDDTLTLVSMDPLHSTDIRRTSLRVWGDRVAVDSTRGCVYVGGSRAQVYDADTLAHVADLTSEFSGRIAVNSERGKVYVTHPSLDKVSVYSAVDCSRTAGTAVATAFLTPTEPPATTVTSVLPTATAVGTSTSAPSPSAGATKTRTPTPWVTTTASPRATAVPVRLALPYLSARQPLVLPTTTSTATPVVCAVAETEPNNTTAQALGLPVICPGMLIFGALSPVEDAGDRSTDLYTVVIGRDLTAHFRLDASAIHAQVEYDLTLWNCATGTCAVVAHRGEVGRSEKEIQIALPSGTYFIAVSARNEVRSEDRYQLGWEILP